MGQSSRWFASVPVRQSVAIWVLGAGIAKATSATAAEDAIQQQHDERDDDPCSATANCKSTAGHAAHSAGAADVLDLGGIELGVVFELHGGDVYARSLGAWREVSDTLATR